MPFWFLIHIEYLEPKSLSEDSMSAVLNVLLLEDCPDDAFLLERELKRGGYFPHIERVWTEPQMQDALSREAWDIVVSDYSMPSFDGLKGLSLLKQSGRDIPFVMVSGSLGEERAVTAMKAGASDFLVKGDLVRLIPVIDRELREAKERQKRRKAEQALAAAEGNFRTLVENSLAGIYVIQGGKFAYVNPTVCEILGFTAEELTTRPLLEFVAPEQRDTVEENVRKRMEGVVKSVRYNLRMLRKNGSIAQVEVHGTRTDYNGQPSILGILLDNTKRKQAEERFSRIFRASPLGITLCSVNDDLIIEANEAFLSMVGYDRDQVLGHSADKLELWADLGDQARIINELKERGRIQNLETELRSRSKEKVQVLVSIELVGIGGEQCALAFFLDITERKKLEAQFLRNQRMESIGTLAGGIAHDLNNALAPIRMCVQLLRTKFDDPAIRETLDVLESSAQRGTDMVRQVLTFARGMEGKHGVVQLKHLIHDLATMTRQTFPVSIRIKEQIATDVWPISGDATQLHQVLLNLCVNARDAMPQGGTLTLAAGNLQLDENAARLHPEAKPGFYTVLSVIDTGTGMPPHIQARIFEPFFTTKEAGKGTGLGLSTVRSIVKSHNGFLTLETAERKGTHFKVYLPAIVSRSDSNVLAERPVLPNGNGECILVVDDEAMIRDIARQVLQTFGYQVLVAANGAEAVAICAKHIGKIRVMVTDLSMPIMDGASTIEAVRSIDPNIRVIVASGSLLQYKAEEPESPTVRAILEKPYTPESLLTTIRNVLSSETNPK
jgi:PAS domain S-box-containing protein